MKEQGHFRLRKGRHSQQNGLYFLTKNLRRPTSLSREQHEDIVTAFRHIHSQGQMLIHAFVVMPDHWHLLMSLMGAGDLGSVVRKIGLRASYPSRIRQERLCWQHGFHDHKIREREPVTEIVDYIECNPVRKGLAESPEKWEWSSCHRRHSDILDRSFLGHERWQ